MISRRHHARHRKPPALIFRIVITVLAALALAAGFIVTLVPASAAPVAAVAVMADRAAAFPASTASFLLDKAQITRAAIRGRAQAAAAVLAAHTYTVRAGDSMSSVAARHCGTARDWTGIYAASRAHQWTTRNANVLTAGQHLYLSCAYLPSMLRYAPAPPPPLVVRAVTVSSGYHRTYHRTYHRNYTAASSGTYRGASGSYEACVIARESRGNASAVNPSSGAGGLYQFLPSTWNSLGYSGLPQNAPVSVQRQAFQKLYARAGTQPWSPSDGC